MNAINQLIERFLILWLLLLSGLAFFADQILPFDIFVASGPAIRWLIFTTMFAIGWTLPQEEVMRVVTRWPTVFGGVAIQYITMPLLAFLLAKQLGMTGSLFVGMMMVGCVPGAMASNVLTLVAKGNTSYSVSLTTLATLLSPIIVPLALKLTLGDSVPADTFWKSAVQLSWMVVLPVITGFSLSCFFPQHKSRASVLGSIIANVSILWIIAFVVAKNRGQLAELHWQVLVGLLLLNGLGYSAGFLGGSAMRLPGGMRRALTLEVGMQNAGLGTALVKDLFPDDSLVLVPPALYTFGCMLTGTVLARIWHRHGEGSESSLR